MRLYSLYGLALSLHEKIHDTLPNKTKATPVEKSKARFEMVEVAAVLRERINNLNAKKPDCSAFEEFIGIPVVIHRTQEKGVIVGINSDKKTIMVELNDLEIFQDYTPEDITFALPNKIMDYSYKTLF